MPTDRIGIPDAPWAWRQKQDEYMQQMLRSGAYLLDARGQPMRDPQTGLLMRNPNFVGQRPQNPFQVRGQQGGMATGLQGGPAPIQYNPSPQGGAPIQQQRQQFRGQAQPQNQQSLLANRLRRGSI